MEMPEGFEYMSITIRIPDTIRLIYATDQEINLVREVILRSWSRGLQSGIGKSGRGYDFKLRGTPFSKVSFAAMALDSRRFVTVLLFQLYSYGLKLIASSNLALGTKLSTWILHREQIQSSWSQMACIGIRSIDKLQFIGFSSAINALLQDVVEKNWPKGVKWVKSKEDDLEIKLKGWPWHPFGDKVNIQAKTLVKALINELGKFHWFLYGSSNLRETSDALFFLYMPNVPHHGLSTVNFMISLNKRDLIRMIDAPSDAIACVKNVITEYWLPNGLQKEQEKLNAHVFKLKGAPWWPSGKGAVSTRVLICKILEALLSIGWRVGIPVDLTKRVNSKSVLPFQRCEPISAPVFCISLHREDLIRFIKAPRDLLLALVNEVQRVWQFGVASYRAYSASFEFKLNGSPWDYGLLGYDSVDGTILLLYLIRLCASKGWYLILSGDVSAKYREEENGLTFPFDLHSLWFMYTGQVCSPDPNDPSIAVEVEDSTMPPAYSIT